MTMISQFEWQMQEAIAAPVPAEVEEGWRLLESIRKNQRDQGYNAFVFGWPVEELELPEQVRGWFDAKIDYLFETSIVCPDEIGRFVIGETS